MEKATFRATASVADAHTDLEVLAHAAGTVPVRREAPGLPLECATGASVWGCGVSWAAVLRGDKAECPVSYFPW